MTPPSPTTVVDRLLEAWPAPGGARLLQVAVAGRWEDARGVDVPTTPAPARALVRGAGPCDADIAVEFEWLGPPLAFVGARRAAGEATAFEEDVARLVERDPAAPPQALALLAGAPPTGLEHIELGAANAWRSVGPLRLWTRGEPVPAQGLGRRLREHPALAHCHVPVALEAAFAGPRSCWLGVEVSVRLPDGTHAVSAAEVEARVARLLA